MNNRVKGEKYELATKLDINKAYDRVEWDFLKCVLFKMEFRRCWVDKIMACISFVKFDLLRFGVLTGIRLARNRPHLLIVYSRMIRFSFL